MTIRPRAAFVAVTLTFAVNVTAVLGTEPQTQTAKPPASRGWTLPVDAAEEKNPLTVNESILAAGRKLFLAKCERCHGAGGKGDGPEADKGHLEHMDLTQKARAARHPDGIVFYKIWNGRSAPKMPAFRTELTRDQAWAIVAYAQTLRGK